jgi:large subunit ribosomal protein L23Ae
MDNKTKQIQKAKNASKAAKKGVHTRKYKIKTKPRFFKPKTLRLASKPKYARGTGTLGLAPKVDKYGILVSPLTSEKCMKKMEDQNTLVFLVHPYANKQQIKKAFKEIYSGTVASVNTLVRPDGKKKAYVRLAPESDALGIANKMGIF